jgi:putative transposase
VSIPFLKLVNQLKHKAKLVGIDIVLANENHPSKCSFLDNEPVKHHGKY